jgi:predicted nucleic acid-binding protein
MQKKVFVDTSTLIILSKINQLELLRLLYGNVYITIEVKLEFRLPIPDWIIEEYANYDSDFSFGIGKGETSILNLAIRNNNSFLIIDELKARKVASNLNLKFTGAIGILIIAKRHGYIHEIKPILDSIMKTNFRISKELYIQVIKTSNEL